MIEVMTSIHETSKWENEPWSCDELKKTTNTPDIIIIPKHTHLNTTTTSSFKKNDSLINILAISAINEEAQTVAFNEV